VTRASVLNLGLPISADQLRDWLMDAPRHGSIAGQTVAATIGMPQAIEPSLNLDEMERKTDRGHVWIASMAHRAKTAQALGIGIRTLSGKLKAYGYAPRSEEQRLEVRAESRNKNSKQSNANSANSAVLRRRIRR